MKIAFRKFVSIIGIAVLCIPCSFSQKNNSDLVTSDISVSSFEKIRIEGTVDVRFHIGDAHRAVLTYNTNLDRDKIEIFSQNSVLYVKNNNKCNNNDFSLFNRNSSKKCLVVVDVYCQVLTSVSIFGSGDFKGIDHITSSTFAVEVTGAGDFTGTVKCDNFSAKISGAGDIRISGTSENADITVAGAGDFRGRSFDTKNATVNINGAGDARISVTDNLKARVSGAGVLTYYGNPKADVSSSGGGNIRKK